MRVTIAVMLFKLVDKIQRRQACVVLGQHSVNIGNHQPKLGCFLKKVFVGTPNVAVLYSLEVFKQAIFAYQQRERRFGGLKTSK